LPLLCSSFRFHPPFSPGNNPNTVNIIMQALLTPRWCCRSIDMENDSDKLTFIFPTCFKLFDDHLTLIPFLWISRSIDLCSRSVINVWKPNSLIHFTLLTLRISLRWDFSLFRGRDVSWDVHNRGICHSIGGRTEESRYLLFLWSLRILIFWVHAMRMRDFRRAYAIIRLVWLVLRVYFLLFVVLMNEVELAS
jgi:hypothetical protein